LRFRHAGFRVTYLGPRTPLEHLAKIVAAVKPDVVALSCVNGDGREKLRVALQAALQALPSGVKVVIGGRAADQHADVCDALGVTRLTDETAWRRFLGPGAPHAM